MIDQCKNIGKIHLKKMFKLLFKNIVSYLLRNKSTLLVEIQLIIVIIKLIVLFMLIKNLQNIFITRIQFGSYSDLCSDLIVLFMI